MNPHPSISLALITEFAGERTRPVRRLPSRRRRARFARRASCDRPISDRLTMA
jgi:hypothetical protein